MCFFKLYDRIICVDELSVNAAIAQSVARVLGKDEVTGSNPVSSSRKTTLQRVVFCYAKVTLGLTKEIKRAPKKYKIFFGKRRKPNKKQGNYVVIAEKRIRVSTKGRGHTVTRLTKGSNR